MPNPIDFFKVIFLHVIPSRVIVPWSIISQETFTCSKPTIETLKKGKTMWSKLTVKTAEPRSGVFIVNLEQISRLF